MKLAGITLALMIAFGGQTAMANTVKCSMTKFSGAKEDIVVSWIGTRFVLDLKSKKAQMGNEKGWWKPIEITKIQKNKKFTAYVAYLITKDARGNQHSQKYSFRVYDDGKGQVQMSQHRYRPVAGKGTCS